MVCPTGDTVAVRTVSPADIRAARDLCRDMNKKDADATIGEDV